MTDLTSGYWAKHLARDFGVDYGDVLLWVDYLRASRRNLRFSTDRRIVLAGALRRIHDALGTERHDQLLDALVAHANARWGEPAPVRVGV